MFDLLKFSDVKEGDILVSPWGSEVEMHWVYKYFVIITFEQEIANLFDKKVFETYFGGWRVKR